MLDTRHETEGAEPVTPQLCRAFELMRSQVSRTENSEGTQAIDIEKAIEALKNAGVRSDAAFLVMTEAEFLNITELNTFVGRALWKGARQQESSESPKTVRPSSLRAASLSLTDLIRQFDPDDVGSPVIRELGARLSHAPGQRSEEPSVIVYDDQKRVMPEITEVLIREVLQGEPSREYVTVDNVRRKTYPLGETPDIIVGVHPITGDNLRMNGEGLDGLPWGNCNQECQQMLSLAVSTQELPSKLSRRDLVGYFALAENAAGLQKLQNEFPLAAEQFRERKLLDSLPRLKRFRGAANEVEDRTDPAVLARRSH
jgi:hypothetical protein